MRHAHASHALDRGGAPIHLVRALGHASITHHRPLPPRPPQGQLRKISRIVNGQNLCRCCYEALQQRGLERSAISCAGWCRAKEGRGCGSRKALYLIMTLAFRYAQQNLAELAEYRRSWTTSGGLASPHLARFGQTSSVRRIIVFHLFFVAWSFFCPSGGTLLRLRLGYGGLFLIIS